MIYNFPSISKLNRIQSFIGPSLTTLLLSLCEMLPICAYQV